MAVGKTTWFATTPPAMKRICRTAVSLLTLPGLALYLLPAPALTAGDDATATVALGAAGTVEGVVTFRGETPKSPVADDAGVRRDLLNVDRTTGGLQNVVVWLAIGEIRPRTNAAPALLDQRDHEFVPRVLAIRTGQPVKFSNSDPANHNVRTSSAQPTNEFNVFTGVDGSHTHRFAADAQNRPVRVGCDIHPWMRGWIYVFDHPQFAVSDAKGRFRIDSLPPGEHILALRQPDIGYVGERKFTVKAGETTRVEIALSTKDVRAR